MDNIDNMNRKLLDGFGWYNAWLKSKINERFFHDSAISIDHSKKMPVCRFYRAPLQKVDFMCWKTVIELILWVH